MICLMTLFQPASALCALHERNKRRGSATDSWKEGTSVQAVGY
jgi:hypothetical protein